MTIYDAIGYGFVVLTSCLGAAAILLSAGYGLYRLIDRHAIGTKYEREAVADLLMRKIADSAPEPTVADLREVERIVR